MLVKLFWLRRLIDDVLVVHINRDDFQQVVHILSAEHGVQFDHRCAPGGYDCAYCPRHIHVVADAFNVAFPNF